MSKRKAPRIRNKIPKLNYHAMPANSETIMQQVKALVNSQPSIIQREKLDHLFGMYKAAFER